jgi:hypothetical protein
MRNWLFQGNTDYFAINKYLNASSEILWSVRRKSFARDVQAANSVILWRAAGKEKNIAGVVASGFLLEILREQPEDPTSLPLWKVRQAERPELRARIRLTYLCTSLRAVVRANCLKNDDPVLSDLRVFGFRSQTIRR